MDGEILPELRAKLEEWLSWDKNENTLAEVRSYIEKGNYEKLQEIMLTRLVFGTAGIRGQMGAGYGCMNDLVIIQTSQGVGKYLLSVSPEVKTKGVVIGFDGRHNSHRFALLAASAFVLCDIPVYLFGRICPTPFVPFTVMQYRASAGIMVTASHNPKEDNGYKVFWNNGAQIISPHDKGIQKSVEDHLRPFEGIWNIENLLNDPKISDPLDDITDKYMALLSASAYDKAINCDMPLKITFTAMHGVSHPYMVKAFQVCNFKPMIPVEEQMEADPDFPTVKFPNPEEGKSALDLSFATADRNNSTIILANDPDADRLAVAEKLKTDEWKVFTGNEIGGLLGWWSWFRCQKLSPEIHREDVYMIASTVSSKILRTIAHKEGFKFIETLTGFKWMGNAAHELIKEGKTVLFAFEEAIGFMNGSEVLDKDGISAAMRLAEMAAYFNTQRMTLYDKLCDIYKTYGYHANHNSYYICHNQDTIRSMFHRIRNFSGPDTYPSSVKNGKYEIDDIRDLTTGYDSSMPDKRAILPSSKSSQMVTFTFTNGCVVTLRTSGTEPKIKYYSEICAPPHLRDWNALEEELHDLVDGVVEEFVQPQKNGLLPRS